MLCMVLFGLVMFGLILADNMDQFMHQQREIAMQKASINVLQMRPHFIYNTMMSIYYLCKQDPDKAQQVTLDFTSYLRKNFTAIASEETIFSVMNLSIPVLTSLLSRHSMRTGCL